jgi:hypothetical protein
MVKPSRRLILVWPKTLKKPRQRSANAPLRAALTDLKEAWRRPSRQLTVTVSRTACHLDRRRTSARLDTCPQEWDGLSDWDARKSVVSPGIFADIGTAASTHLPSGEAAIVSPVGRDCGNETAASDFAA